MLQPIKNRKVALVGNGTRVDFSDQLILHAYDEVIAVDGGAALCETLHITPSHIIGDGDSYQNVPQVDADQSTTDLQKAVRYAMSSDTSTQIDAFAMFSEDRPDHSLAMLSALTQLPRGSRLFTSTATIEYVANHITLSEVPGTRFSLLPTQLEARIVVSIDGAEWSGEHAILSPLQHSAISNVTTAPNTGITIMESPDNCGLLAITYNHSFAAV